MMSGSGSRPAEPPLASHRSNHTPPGPSRAQAEPGYAGIVSSMATVADQHLAAGSDGPADDPDGVAARPVAIRAGTVDYLAAWAEQRRLHEAVVAGEQPDSVLLLEHPSVYTAGKRTEPWDRPLDGTPVVDVDRGGKITWHGPGQLVGYPIMKLPGPDQGQPADVVAFVRRTERLLLDVCAEVGLRATTIEGRSGAWVPADDRGPDRKVAAIGIRVSRGVTQHGFAINCDCDLAAFDRIVPCGLRDASVTSLTAELGRPVTVAEILPIVERRLGTLLG